MLLYPLHGQLKHVLALGPGQKANGITLGGFGPRPEGNGIAFGGLWPRPEGNGIAFGDFWAFCFFLPLFRPDGIATGEGANE